MKPALPNRQWRSALAQQRAFDTEFEENRLRGESVEQWLIDAGFTASSGLDERIMRRIRAEREGCSSWSWRPLWTAGLLLLCLMGVVGFIAGNLLSSLDFSPEEQVVVGVFWMIVSLAICGVLLSLVLLGYGEMDKNREEKSWREAL